MLLLAALLLFSQAPQGEKLCSVKTVYIEGHGGTYNWFRKNIEKKTWLRIQNVKPEADAILEVGGVGSMAYPVNFRMKRRDPEELLYEDSERADFKFWGDTPSETILKRFNKAANCPKPEPPKNKP